MLALSWSQAVKWAGQREGGGGCGWLKELSLMEWSGLATDFIQIAAIGRSSNTQHGQQDTRFVSVFFFLAFVFFVFAVFNSIKITKSREEKNCPRCSIQNHISKAVSTATTTATTVFICYCLFKIPCNPLQLFMGGGEWGSIAEHIKHIYSWSGLVTKARKLALTWERACSRYLPQRSCYR